MTQLWAIEDEVRGQLPQARRAARRDVGRNPAGAVRPLGAGTARISSKLRIRNGYSGWRREAWGEGRGAEALKP